MFFPAIIPHLHHDARRDRRTQSQLSSQRKRRSQFRDDGRVNGGDVKVAGESEHAAEEEACVLKAGGDRSTRAVGDDGKSASFHPLDDVETGSGIAVSNDEGIGRRSLRTGLMGEVFTSDGGVVD